MLEDAARCSELDMYFFEAGSTIIPAARSTGPTGGLLYFPPEILLHIRASV
jgi:hypothetical protein